MAELYNPKELSLHPDDVNIFTCTKRPVELDLPAGYLRITLYGASGGKSPLNNYGLGGMISGKFFSDKPMHVFLYVGGQGEQALWGYWVTTNPKGGYNGGGDARTTKTKFISDSSAGGGATDIRLTEDSSSRILVAGAGGGAGRSIAGNRGHGGYPEGFPGMTQEFNRVVQPGTQTSGYALGVGQSGSPNTWSQLWCDAEGSGGGGAGYWGGRCWTGTGRGTNATGAGGSSYIDTNYFTDIEYENGCNDGDGLAKIQMVGYARMYLLSDPKLKSFIDDYWQPLE